MKTATKKKVSTFVKFAMISQVFCVGAYVEVNTLVDQWHNAHALVSGLMRAAGSLFGM